MASTKRQIRSDIAYEHFENRISVKRRMISDSTFKISDCKLHKSLEGNLHTIVSFLETEDILRLRVCRKLKNYIPSNTFKISIEDSRFLQLPIFQFYNVRSLTLRSIVGRTSTSVLSVTRVMDYVKCLLNLEEICIHTNDPTFAGSVLESSKHNKYIEKICLHGHSVLHNELDLKKGIISLVSAFIGRKWSSLKHFEFVGDWFSADVTALFLLKLKQLNVFDGMKELILEVPKSDVGRQFVWPTLEHVFSNSGGRDVLEFIEIRNIVAIPKLENSAKSSFLHSRYLRKIRLNLNGIHMKVLNSYLRQINPSSIESLSISFCTESPDDEDAIIFAETISKMSNIVQLKLANGCNLPPSQTDAIIKHISQSELFHLEELSFSTCFLNPNIGTNLSQLISSSPKLQKVDFSGNFINDIGAALIGQTLKQFCPKLELLRIGSNKITEVGLLDLVKIFACCRFRFTLDISSTLDDGNICFPNTSCVSFLTSFLQILRNKSFNLLLNSRAVLLTYGFQLSSTVQCRKEIFSLQSLISCKAAT